VTTSLPIRSIARDFEKYKRLSLSEKRAWRKTPSGAALCLSPR
jgi:hypothetical protein